MSQVALINPNTTRPAIASPGVGFVAEPVAGCIRPMRRS